MVEKKRLPIAGNLFEMKKETATEPDRLARENARLRGDLLTLATRISHDLRAPLGGVASTGEMLREILADKEPALVALTDLLFSSVSELTRLVKNVNAVAAASATPRAKEKIQMGGIVAGVLQQLERRALKRGAVIGQPASWPEVAGVGDWLEIIWWNLLANALQHAGDSPRIEFGWREEAKTIRFWISDNGPGVSAENIPKLFQPFDTLHHPGSARGLGLSVVQRLVTLQDGGCGYESAGGRNSFFFTLPARRTKKMP